MSNVYFLCVNDFYMSYVYKTILKAENHDFDYFKNRHNSLFSGVIAIDRKSGETDHVCRVDNRTGDIVFSIDCKKFKASTRNKLLYFLKQYIKS